jgi:hypothetical protein
MFGRLGSPVLPFAPGSEYCLPMGWKSSLLALALAAALFLSHAAERKSTNMSATQTGQTHSHTNRLAREKSPYLLQHQHNPVDWFPWGTEAFEKSKKENKPILLSIGYSTCHWCHVMERESFEDEHLA